MAVWREKEVRIGRFAQVGWGIWQVLDLLPGFSPKASGLATHEERPKLSCRPSEVEEVSRVKEAKDLPDAAYAGSPYA